VFLFYNFLLFIRARYLLPNQLCRLTSYAECISTWTQALGIGLDTSLDVGLDISLDISLDIRLDISLDNSLDISLAIGLGIAKGHSNALSIAESCATRPSSWSFPLPPETQPPMLAYNACHSHAI
jgi:hypothetical protein